MPRDFAEAGADDALHIEDRVFQPPPVRAADCFFQCDIQKLCFHDLSLLR